MTFRSNYNASNAIPYSTQITRKLQEKFLFVERWVMCRTLNNGWRRGIVFLRVSFFGSKATSNLFNDAAYREINTSPPE
jgi:hypothetical protein